MLRYWMESLRELLNKPPRFHDVWTYAGVACMSGMFTGLFRLFLFTQLMPEYPNELRVLFAAALTLLLVWFLLKKMKIQYPLAVTVGAMCMGIPFWPTLELESFPRYVAVPLFLVGAALSLPIFMRGIRIIRPT